MAQRCDRPRGLRLTLRTPGAMAQPGIPAARGAAVGLQAQNGAASASGSPYTNGECRMGAGRTARPGPGRPPCWVCRGEWQGTARPGSRGRCAPAAPRWGHSFTCIYTFGQQTVSTCAVQRPRETRGEKESQMKSVLQNCLTGEVIVSGCHHPPRQPQSGVLEGRVHLWSVSSERSGVRIVFISTSLRR